MLMFDFASLEANMEELARRRVEFILAFQPFTAPFIGEALALMAIFNAPRLQRLMAIKPPTAS